MSTANQSRLLPVMTKLLLDSNGGEMTEERLKIARELASRIDKIFESSQNRSSEFQVGTIIGNAQAYARSVRNGGQS